MKEPLAWQVEDIPKPHKLRRALEKESGAVRRISGGAWKTPIARASKYLEESGALGKDIQRDIKIIEKRRR